MLPPAVATGSVAMWIGRADATGNSARGVVHALQQAKRVSWCDTPGIDGDRAESPCTKPRR
ncbi:hypothetical protein CI784_08885 [Arthrobacter agilis]|nr:hypothetical protein B8W74_06690 [Arthrobacter agilis]PPB45880.1 hypothetical protein CI784_08885 [Arthrobacter agilis]